MYSRIARAQFDAGARQAAIETASRIEGDQARSSVLSDFARRRLEMGSTSAGYASQMNTESTSLAENNSSRSAMGGGVVADFDPLMELIQTTVAPESWEENGGTGTIAEFASGVKVDASGSLARIKSGKSNPRLEELRKSAMESTANSDVRKSSRIRKVSLTRLEKELQLRAASGLPIADEMNLFAGMYEIKYLLVYPESGDIVIAGPAGDWVVDAEGRKVNVETGKPLLRLEDFVVCLRNAFSADGKFGCSIDPRRENLAATQEFLAASKLKGDAWRKGVRETLGKQDIVVSGIDPGSNTARTIVEADYRMKLVGMGLEESIAEVKSYLDLVTLDKNGNPPPMDVARWWFTLNYDSIVATESEDAFELIGTGVKVLSEQEMIDATGKRIHTGKTAGPTLEFADGFTTHFSRMAEKYPVYAELKNVFDFALVAAIIRDRGCDSKVGWSRTYFGEATDENQFVYLSPTAPSPREVDSVMNHRIIEATKGGRKFRHTILGVSGGVTVNTSLMLAKMKAPNGQSQIVDSHKLAKPSELPHHAWWWD